MKQSKSSVLRQACSVWVMVAAASAAVPPAGAQPATAAPPAPAPAEAGTADGAQALSADQIGYLFGLTFGEQMHGVGIAQEIAIDAVTRGVQAGLQGKNTTAADQEQLRAFVHSLMEATVARNKAAATEFLAHNAHERGVTATASGLQYKVLVAGNRKAPAIAATDEVTVNFRGRLIDGTEFDNTYTRNLPVSFKVDQVLPGWQEALVLMKPGAKWQLFVPPELAYGVHPRQNIPAGSLLIYDMEVLSVTPAAVAPKTP